MLEVKNVTKRYGKNVAVNNVSFSIDRGVTVLLGPNGAGKSTLIKSIIGFLRYEGQITVNGNPNKTPEARRVIGYIPELPSLYPNLTVGEHMEFLARAYRLTDWKPYADSLIKRFELDGQLTKFGDELSKGMQQKVNLCLGLLPKPSIVLMDEPMIGLDPHAIKELKELMNELREEGRALLVSTHMIDSIDMLWDRTLIMQKGELRADVTRDSIESSGETLEKLFFEITEGAGAPSDAGQGEDK